MPIQHAIWKVGDQPLPLSASRLASEQQLEEMIVRDSSILSSEWMLIGQQEVTSHGGRIDLLAIAPDGSLVLIELKRDRTPREIAAQALDYASWVDQLGADRIAQIYQRFSDGGNLDEAFQERFGAELDEETLNQSHQIIIVAAELDDATERIIGYLNAREVAINVLFFQVFQHGDELLLSRAWFIDPGDTQANVAGTTKGKAEKEPWNGEYYVSYGPPNCALVGRRPNVRLHRCKRWGLVYPDAEAPFARRPRLGQDSKDRIRWCRPGNGGNVPGERLHGRDA